MMEKNILYPKIKFLKSNNQKIATFLLLFFGLFFAKSQVTLTTTASAQIYYYSNVRNAFDGINAGTHNGNVTIMITGNTNEGTVAATINRSGTGSANYTSVLIKPASGVKPTISGSVDNNALIRLYGSNNVTIDGSNNGTDSRDLTITNTSTTSPRVINVGSIASYFINNVTIKNSIIINGANTAQALVFGGDTIASDGYFVGITVQNNDIRKASIGVSVHSVVGTGMKNMNITRNLFNSSGADAIRTIGIYVKGMRGLTISENVLGNFNSSSSEEDCAIHLATGTDFATISKNTISNMSSGSFSLIGIGLNTGLANSNINIDHNTINNLSSSGFSPIFGIYTSGPITSGVTIRNNKISNIRNTNTGGYGAVGIFLSQGNSSNTKVFNNFIWDIAGFGSNSYFYDRGGFGIVVNSGRGYDIDHNTISLNTNQTNANSKSACLLITNSVNSNAAINLRNNIFANFQTVGTSDSKLAIASLATTGSAVYGTINGNNYFTTSGNLSVKGSDPVTTNLTALRTSLGQNLNSVSVNPNFVSPTDLHLSTVVLGLKTTLIPSINGDIDDDVRRVTFMGADEYQFIETPGAGNILYVDKNVVGGNGSGDSWANAITELADALKWARLQAGFSIANPLKIYVAKGTYKPLYSATESNYNNNGGRSNAFVMINNVQLYGGFNPVNGIDDLNDTRIFGNDGSILSGDIGTTTENTDNTYHVVISSGDVGVARLDGFTVTDGYANGVGSVIVGSNFIDHFAGAGIYNYRSNPVIKNVIITKNTIYFTSGSSAYGGGMFNGDANPVLINVLVSHNTTSSSLGGYGGGIYNRNSNPTLTNVTIVSNIVKGPISSGSIGGGMRNSNSSPKIYNSIFWGNIKLNNTTTAGADIENGGAVSLTLKNSITQGYTTGVATDNNLVNVDPLFTNATTGDFSLQNISPAINKGDNTLYTNAGGNLTADKDLVGNPRVSDVVVDMGAYEYQVEDLVPGTDNILYVDIANTTGNGSGDSWANAVKELSDALKWARQKEFTTANPLKIYVARGIYKPLYGATDGMFSANGNRDNAFVLLKNVKMYGGFDPANSITDLTHTRIIPNEETAAPNGTILSGDLDNSNSLTNLDAYHVVIASDINTPITGTVLSGFTITGAYANGVGNIPVNVYSIVRNGGAGFSITNSQLTIENVRIQGNKCHSDTSHSNIYGAGLSATYSTLDFRNINFSGNDIVSVSVSSANTKGGAMSIFSSDITMKNVSFINNAVSNNSMYDTSSSGGAIHFESYGSAYKLNIINGKFFNNLALSYRAGNITSGGAIYYNSPDSLLSLINVSMSGNFANGAGSQTFGGGLRAEDTGRVNISNSILWGNTKRIGFNTPVMSNLENGGATNKTIRNSLVGGSFISNVWQTSMGTNGGGNLDANPIFTNAAGGNFSLDNSSPAIEKGNNTLYTNIGGNLNEDKDILGNPRLIASTIDMGAYENQSLPITPDAQNILYVDTNVPVSSNGSGNSWENAIKEVADALRWARTQNNFTIGNPLKIYVAKGTYKPLYNAADTYFTSTGSATAGYSDRDNAFVMVNNVQLYGGFDPLNNIDDLSDNRIFGSEGSILSGDFNGNDSSTGTGVTFTLTNNSENAHHVVLASGAVIAATLDGFSIKSGNANGSGPIYLNATSYHRHIAGGVNTDSPNLTLKNVVVSHNMSFNTLDSAFSAGIYNRGSNFKLTNAEVSSNITYSSSAAYGGGIWSEGNNAIFTNVTVTNNKVRGNSPANSFGGGIRNLGGSTKMYNCIIWDNVKFDAIGNAGSDIQNGNQISIKNSITQNYNTGFVPADNNLVGINPQFTNASLGDFSLQNTSPAIDTGSFTLYNSNGGNGITTDLSGNPRVSECSIDMGAFEYQFPGIFTLWENAAWSNGIPTQTTNVCINEPYNLATNFTSKDIKITPAGSLNIQPNHNVTVYGNITQNSDNSIVLESDAGLVQINDNAVNSNYKIQVKRNTHMRKMDYTYWGSPVSGQKLLNNAAIDDGFSVGTPNNRIYKYNEPNDYYVATSDQYFIPGKGYAIRGKDGFPELNLMLHSYQFNGLINNGSYTAEVQKSKNIISNNTEYEHGYNLIGNPYPSNIDFDKFFNLANNSSKIFGKAWFWTNASPVINQSGSGYSGNNFATLTLLGGVPPTSTTQPNMSLTPTQFIKVGQGFIVKVRDEMTTTSPTITYDLDFDNSIRSAEAGIFYNAKNNTQKDRFWLQLISPQDFTNTILLGYVNGSSNGFDGDYDAEILSIGDDSVYTLSNNKKLQVEGRQYPLSLKDRVPLGTKYSESGIYKIKIISADGIFSSLQNIYLIDKLLNKIVNLSEEDYNFQAIAGTNETRFELVYKSDFLETNNLTKNNLIIYKDENDFVIRANENINKVQMFDFSGKLIKEINGNSKEIRINHINLVNGGYLLKIYKKEEILTKKVLK